ncbi:ChaN family lipoprotein [Chitinimonas koreensis]|uniref:ChaN family lipoprotein n=1 Tax=Chitinimonas koreensis TaxID=356302 RepID=UPI0027E5A644|nr:ChaN family lipoprotein [Chitinimonas koreensis]
MRLLMSFLAAATLAACATPARTDRAAAPAAQADQLAGLLEGDAVVLLGEVHDNAAVHDFRFRALERAVAAGWRPAIAMEQFDRERQADLDRARQERPGDADYLIEQAKPAGKSGWNWAFYRPVVALALRYDLPIVAANLSRADGAKVVREGYAAVFTPAQIAAAGLDKPLPAALFDGQREAVDRGHCGKLPASLLDGMARAQIARDVAMAEALKPYAGRGAVLLAGNGHVRRDIGVPRWLPGSVSVGLLEGENAERYDRKLLLPAQQRPDPCAALD